MAGVPEALATTDDKLAAIGAVFGLDRAGRDAPAGGRPWLETRPGEALRRAAGAVGRAPLQRALDAATEADLEWARLGAERLAGPLLSFLELAEAQGEPGFAGLGILDGLRTPLGPAYLVLASLADKEQGRKVTAMIVEEASSVSP